jgi:hypothetical protein
LRCTTIRAGSTPLARCRSRMRGTRTEQKGGIPQGGTRQRRAIFQMSRIRPASLAGTQVDPLLPAEALVLTHHELPVAQPPGIMKRDHIRNIPLPAHIDQPHAQPWVA